jgi:gluconolactonase
MDWEFELVAGPYDRLTEGPAWDGSSLLFTHISQSRIMRYDPQTGSCVEYRTGTNRTNGLAFDSTGRLYGCCSGGRSIIRFEPDGSTTVIVDRLDGQRINTPNDLAIDRQGRIWFTNPWNEGNIDPSERMEVGHEEVLRADPQPDGSWSLTRATYDCTKPNGILVSPDERTLYVAQSHSEAGRIRELRAYPILDDGSLGPYTLLHQFGEDHRGPQRGIDGMCFDSDGNIIATAGWGRSGPGPMLYVFAPSGRILETHPMPVGVDMPTNCAFGDANLRTLYMTTLEGQLYRVRNTGRRGWLMWPPAR